MDWTRYSALKAKGLISLSKANDAHAATVRRFDPEDGRETAPEVEAIDKKDLETTIDKRKAELNSLNQLLTDLP